MLYQKMKFSVELIVLSCVISVLALNSAASEDFDIDHDLSLSDASESHKKIDNDTILTTLTGSLKLSDTNLSLSIHIWEIEPNTKSKHDPFKINLFFTDLFLHEEDKITIFRSKEESSNDTNSIIKPILAQNGSITIMTDEPTLIVKLEGHSNSFLRRFSALFSSESCAFAIPPDTQIIHSPIYIGNASSTECKYTYNHDPHHRSYPLFWFDSYNFTASSIKLEGTTYPFGDYQKNSMIDFFPDKSKNAMSIDVQLNNFNETFCLHMRMVDTECSGFIDIINSYPVPIESPNYALDNGTFGTECVWIVRHTDPKSILGAVFTKIDFNDVLDIVAINDGSSRISPPLYQVTTSNANHSKIQLLRSSGPYLWISFKPVNFVSKMIANITTHGQGGHFKGSGDISMKNTVGNDTIFMLEVEENAVVLLNFTSSEFTYPATVDVYDGFDTNNLITTLHETVWYPILSSSSKMMIIATSFDKGSFKASFKGVSPGCMHTSTMTNQNYVLSGNCNNTCLWIIPPQNLPRSELLLDFQFISLDKDDTVEIYRLDSLKTLIGTVDSTMLHVPQMVFNASVGALVEITRKTCTKESDVVLVGHSSYIPVCGGNLDVKPNETFYITSPLYPDTYPLLAQCTWLLSAPANSLIHLAFNTFSLNPNHCLKIIDSKTNTTTDISGFNLPDDLFLSAGTSLQFSSADCKAPKTPLQLVSSEGFMMNGTLAECGKVYEKSMTGEFTINVTSLNQSLCMWKVSVPPTTDDAKESVNVIGYTVTVKEDKGNYELKVFDGASVRDTQINNASTSQVWSRTNDLIFYYKRPNVTNLSSVFVVKYTAITCNSSMLCANNICMHPDWKCNGLNDCGDFSDELNCGAVPIPPEIKTTGYSATAFWVTILFMLILGGVVGGGVLTCYQKYKSGYHRFSDISVIE